MKGSNFASTFFRFQSLITISAEKRISSLFLLDLPFASEAKHARHRGGECQREKRHVTLRRRLRDTHTTALRAKRRIEEEGRSLVLAQPCIYGSNRLIIIIPPAPPPPPTPSTHCAVQYSTPVCAQLGASIIQLSLAGREEPKNSGEKCKPKLTGRGWKQNRSWRRRKSGPRQSINHHGRTGMAICKFAS